MLNSAPTPTDADIASQQDPAMQAILQSGAGGAALVAGIATLIVVAIWFAFYLLVFMPRAGAS